MADNIAEHLAREWELVWTNSSPTSDFAAKTISLDLSNCAFVRIQARVGTSLARSVYYDIPIGGSEYISSHYIEMFNGSATQTSSTASLYGQTRKVTATTTGVTFSTGYYKPTNNTNAVASDAGRVIPVRIWAR